MRGLCLTRYLTLTARLKVPLAHFAPVRTVNKVNMSTLAKKLMVIIAILYVSCIVLLGVLKLTIPSMEGLTVTEIVIGPAITIASTCSILALVSLALFRQKKNDRK
jgi:hypothetical protein